MSLHVVKRSETPRLYKKFTMDLLCLAQSCRRRRTLSKDRVGGSHCKDTKATPVCAGVRNQCVKGRKLMIHPEFAEYAVKRAQYLLYYDRQLEDGGTWCAGFAICRVLKIKSTRFMYIDLVCSRHKKGRALIKDIENIAKGLKISVVGLRASSKNLLSYYRKAGFHQTTNQCKDETKALRLFRRTVLDKTALKDGKPFDGWFMSKCIRA